MMLVERPVLYPGAGLRGLSSQRGFVDTGCDMPVGGRVYLEEQTVHEAALLFGYLSPVDAAKLREQLADARRELEAACVELERLRPIADALRTAAA